MINYLLFLFPIKTTNVWKFPGGLSEPGEDIGKYLSAGAINVCYWSFYPTVKLSIRLVWPALVPH